jgi:CBS-domain-containing membrane protein
MGAAHMDFSRSLHPPGYKVAALAGLADTRARKGTTDG